VTLVIGPDDEACGNGHQEHNNEGQHGASYRAPKPTRRTSSAPIST
jgi:hypothetical protein